MHGDDHVVSGAVLSLSVPAPLEFLNDVLVGPIDAVCAERDRLQGELELHRARLDATTRAMLAVEAEDDDAECTLVNRRDLDTALGVARRNREDLELGDDI